MKVISHLILTAAFALQAVGCASTTIINSEPQGAKLYLDGNMVGATPYTLSDTKIVGSTTTVTLKKEGCLTVNASFSRSEQFEVGPCIGGVLVLVPFLWVMGYNPVRTYEMECGNKSADVYGPMRDMNEVSLASNEMSQTNSAPQCAFGF